MKGGADARPDGVVGECVYPGYHKGTIRVLVYDLVAIWVRVLYAYSSSRAAAVSKKKMKSLSRGHQLTAKTALKRHGSHSIFDVGLLCEIVTRSDDVACV